MRPYTPEERFEMVNSIVAELEQMHRDEPQPIQTYAEFEQPPEQSGGFLFKNSLLTYPIKYLIVFIVGAGAPNITHRSSKRK